MEKCTLFSSDGSGTQIFLSYCDCEVKHTPAIPYRQRFWGTLKNHFPQKILGTRMIAIVSEANLTAACLLALGCQPHQGLVQPILLHQSCEECCDIFRYKFMYSLCLQDQLSGQLKTEPSLTQSFTKYMLGNHDHICLLEVVST